MCARLRSPRWRDRLADALTPLVCAISKKQIYIARTNLAICFKEKSEAEREAILMTSIRVGLKSLLGFGEFTWRSPRPRDGADPGQRLGTYRGGAGRWPTGDPGGAPSWPIDAAGYFAQRGRPCAP